MDGDASIYLPIYRIFREANRKGKSPSCTTACDGSIRRPADLVHHAEVARAERVQLAARVLDEVGRVLRRHAVRLAPVPRRARRVHGRVPVARRDADAADEDLAAVLDRAL